MTVAGLHDLTSLGGQERDTSRTLRMKAQCKVTSQTFVYTICSLFY